MCETVFLQSGRGMKKLITEIGKHTHQQGSESWEPRPALLGLFL